MALAEDLKDGLDFIKQVQAAAKDKKPELEKAAEQIESIAAAIKAAVNGDPSKLEITRTQWEGVNRLLAAKASAEAELTKGAAPDWNRIGDSVAGVAGVAIKVALAVATVA